MSESRDPVQRSLDGVRDLYDVATWEERTLLDRIAVRLHRFLGRVTRGTVILTGLLILIVELAVTGVAVVEDPILGLMTLLSVVPALALAGYIWLGDPTLREPPRALIVTFILGVLLAGFAAVLNTLLQGPFTLIPVVGFSLYFFIVVGPVEEVVKWLAVRLYAYRRPDFHAVVDGAVYGAMAGLGFATIENTLYITRVYLTAAGSTGTPVVPATVGITGIRSLAGPGHVIYTAFSGYYLGLAKFNPDNAGPIVVKGLLIAVLIHGLYNTLATVIPFSLLGFVGFVVVFDGLFLTILFRKLSRYRSLYTEASVAEESVSVPRSAEE